MLLLLLALLSAARAAGWEPSDAADGEFLAGKELLESGDPSTAEGRFRAAVAREPGCGRCQLGLGYALLLQNRAREALGTFAAAITQFPEQPDLRVAQSEAAFAAQDFALAKQAAERAVALDPEGLDGWMALEAALLRVGDTRSAGDALDQAQLSLPAPELACLEAELRLEMKDVGRAADLLTDCGRATRTDLSRRVRGLVAQARGDSAAAQASAEALGEDTVGWMIRAVAAYNNGDPAEALRLFDAVLEVAPDRLDARIARGQARYRLGDLAGARADLETAFAGGAWVEVHRSGLMSGVLRKSDEVKLARLVQDGGALLVRLLVDAGELDAAAEALERAQQAGAASAGLAASEAWLRGAQGDLPGAWATLAAPLAAGAQDPLLREVAGRLAFQHPEGVPAAVSGAILARGPAAARYNLAAGRERAGDPAGCLAAMAAAPAAEREELSAADQGSYERLGWRCAVSAGQLDVAGRWFSAMEAHTEGRLLLEGEAFAPCFNHALALQKAGRGPDARSVLSHCAPGDDRGRGVAAALSLSLAAEAADWDAALKAAETPGVPAWDRAWLAGALANAGREADARALLAAACPALAGDEAAQCQALRDSLSP